MLFQEKTTPLFIGSGGSYTTAALDDDGDEAYFLLHYYLNNKTATITQEDIDKIATVLLSNIENNKQLNYTAKPLLWRLGYIK